jgi:hypothetical protein
MDIRSAWLSQPRQHAWDVVAAPSAGLVCIDTHAQGILRHAIGVRSFAAAGSCFQRQIAPGRSPRSALTLVADFGDNRSMPEPDGSMNGLLAAWARSARLRSGVRILAASNCDHSHMPAARTTSPTLRK